jgi:hypothetical protein
MDRVIDTYYLPKLNQEDLNNLNYSTRNNEIEAAIKSLPTKESQIFTAEFYSNF